MKFKKIAESITGVSCPYFGVSWTPPKFESTTAGEILVFLEDKRVLYRDFDVEMPQQSIYSVNEIRNYLTEHLQKLDAASELGKSVKDLRLACRKFVNTVEDDRLNNSNQVIQTAVFNRALQDLRKTFGKNIAKMSLSYGLDVEDDLATIMPFDRY